MLFRIVAKQPTLTVVMLGEFVADLLLTGDSVEAIYREVGTAVIVVDVNREQKE